MSQQDFLLLVQQAARELIDLAPERIVLIHHNDSDGLSSAAILLKALDRKALQLYRYCLEKPYPLVLERIFSDNDLPKKTCILITDFASGMLPQLSLLNSRAFPIFVLDHHAINPVDDKNIHLINCMKYGIDGSSECSSSTVCYQFALALQNWNIDLAGLSLVGAFGDGHITEKNHGLGLHKLSVQAAASQSQISFDEYLMLKQGRTTLQLGKLVQYVDALGSYAYLKGGPDIAIKGLLEGFDERYTSSAERCISDFENAYSKFLIDLKLQQTKTLQYFFLPESFNEFGVKTVGLVCERLIKENLVDAKKYLVGFQKIPDVVPGLGPINFNQQKISLRLPPELLTLVRSKEKPAISEILPAATLEVGGFTDACHLHAGASTLTQGKEKQFIQALDSKA